MNALTAHIVVESATSMTKIQKLKKEITHKLVHENIKHVTLQIDTVGECEDVDCS